MFGCHIFFSGRTKKASVRNCVAETGSVSNLYSADDVASGSVSMETVLLVIEFIDCGLRVCLSVLLYNYLS